MKIEIAVTCVWFQKRLCWMLSSILQQKGDIPDITFNVGYVRNNGCPRTEDVCSFFRDKGLNIRELVYEDMKKIQYRGLVRNDQLASTDADWIYFADADMTYDPNFFESLKFNLENKYKDEKTVMSARRVSLAKDYCIDLFNNDKREYPIVIDNAGMLNDWPIFDRGRRFACAGYCQIANVKHLRENFGGIYVNPKRCKDWSWENQVQKAHSDKQFRWMVGGRCEIKGLPPQYHLNHERDNEAGKHLTNQR